ncbi:MAG: ATP-dependent Clp protease ATP-binding subunit [Verrucomicrobia bacterium]|nr:ATP-dependent Clp protease ATP-binding subunit [Verrucomicrobiota bacterium]
MAASGDTPRAGSITEEQFVADPATPRWIKDVFRFLPVKSQFVLSGNVRDRYPFPMAGGKYAPQSLLQYLTEALRLRGYERFIWFRPTDGFSVVMPKDGQVAECREFFKDHFKLSFDENGRAKCSLEKSLDYIEQMANWREDFIAIFADFASRYAIRLDSLTEHEHGYFSRALVLSHEVMPHNTARLPQAQFNSLFWICDKENDLPGWLTMENSRIRCVIVPKPDHVMRRALVQVLTQNLEGYAEAPAEQKQVSHDVFVDQTEGMALTDVIAITQLCRREKLPFHEIGEAVRRYKVGVTEDPWKKLDRTKIANGEEFIRRRVKGQPQAVTKALDIVKRAVTGLSGAQGSKVGGRPRGVMFLAGPTGVGKTELAKALTELLFNDERAYIRFDMSEFSAEHADQRLLGAPPGYVGYDAGGELTNAIKGKPFCVVLFDEIEKAHPRILDKFLQLLDEGVLTSGRGERVYFSESVIILTSNLGIYRLDEFGNRVLNITPEDIAKGYAEVERKVREEIGSYFKNQLGRPEILNRMGENIVVFDFIRPEVAVQIYDKMVENILSRLADKQKIRVTIPDDVNVVLRDRCTRDLSNGGRGIGNQLEAWLINPLARALFDNNVQEGASVSIALVEEVNQVPVVRLG